MLMSQKMGRRLADDCMSPTQAAANEELKKNPMPSLLEPLPVEKSVPAQTSEAKPAEPPATMPAAAPQATPAAAVSK
jgi:hypothetical protein